MLSLEEEAGLLLRKKKYSLAVAESCTGGMISDRLTNIPGSSDYFVSGFVTYSNSTKETVLGVEHNLLTDHGAVSGPVAGAMAIGAKLKSGADIALAVTGIAGPAGGSPGKPVGLVYIAVNGPLGTEVAKFHFKGDRLSIKKQSADAALKMLKEALIGPGK